jgi:hypothetical protein
VESNSWNVVVLIVDAVIASLNVAVTVAVVATLPAPLTGVTPATDGAVVSAPPPGPLKTTSTQ